MVGCAVEASVFAVQLEMACEMLEVDMPLMLSLRRRLPLRGKAYVNFSGITGRH